MKMKTLIILNLLLFSLFSCEKETEKKGQVTIGADWSLLNCGPGTAKVYINDRFEGELLNSIDTIIYCNQEGSLTIQKQPDIYNYKADFKNGCSIKNGQFTIIPDSCILITVKF